jgi:CHAD domain-containing protein
LLEDLEARREVARERLLDVLRSQRYVDLLEQLVEGAAAPPLTAAAGQAARDVLPAVAARSWRKAARAGRALDRNSPDEDFHEVRKRTKQARYAAEAVAPALGRRRGEEARAFARRAADVQDVLGELQDAVVAEAAIQQFADVQSRSPQTQFAAGRLLERQRAARSAARDDFAGVWRKLDRPKRRRWM